MQIRRTLLILFLALVVLGKVLDFIDGQEIPDQVQQDVVVQGEQDSPLRASLSAAQQAYNEENYLRALQILERDTNQLADVAPSLLLQYYTLKGKVHWRLWQYIEAEQAWQTARQYTASQRHARMLDKLLSESQRVVQDINLERNNKSIYIASPNRGPAGVLNGRILLVYVFLVDGGSSGWSLRERQHVLTTWELSEAWLRRQAARYNAAPEFSKRIFILDKHPLISRMEVGDVARKYANVDQVVQLAAEHFGFDNIMQFTHKLRNEEQADHVMLMLHVPRDSRSFASRCMRSCSMLGEFVFLMESPSPKRWQSLGYAQAHESLHLFGADDLYNISKAQRYAVRDIMNYPASVLEASTLEELTAYAIGLRSKQPVTPFEIKTIR